MIDDFGPRGSVKPAPKLKPIPSQNKLPELDASFKTPEEVAAGDSPASVRTPAVTDAEPPKVHKMPGHHWFNLPWPPNKQEIILSSLVLAMAIAGITGFVLLHKPQPVATVKVPVHAAKKVVAPTTVPSQLSGLPVAPSENNQPVTAVMIENSIDARPQSGLGQAGVVFEAVAEGGVTRFMALFQDQQPTNIGPIRSLRPYYLQWALGFDAPIAHVGGSPDALADIKAWGGKDLDEFANGGSYHRISTRAAPHNVYTGVPTLEQLEASKGWTKSSFTSFVRKPDTPSKTPNATSIDFNLSGAIYNPHYDYVATTNSYNRSEGGSPQIDANSNTQLSPKVVIAIVVPESQGALDATGAYYSDYNPVGSGTAYVFQDGLVTTGSWSKPAINSQISFSDASGQPLKLNAGQTWITAVTATSKVTYK